MIRRRERSGSIEFRQNYPNPFNSGTTIAFRIPEALAHSPVTLSVYNVQGQLVQTSA
jgi:hypothetical protein